MATPGEDVERLAVGYGLIEGPLWIAGRGLVFSDVLGGGIYQLNDSGVSTVFEHRRGVGGMSEHVAGGLVVSGRNIAYKAFDGGPTQVLFERDEDAGIVGFNDITTDSEGRVYAGSLGASPVFDDGLPPRAGDLYLIDLNGETAKVGEDVRLTNGLGFSPDGRTLYHSDSTRRGIYQYPVHGDGTLGEKTLFARTEVGAPDGLVVAEDGSVWAALAGGGAGVGVWNRDGTVRGHVGIPQPMCTSVCFGGDDLRDLYIVSGSEGSGSDNAGAVYRVRTEVAGVPVAPARVALPG